VLLMILLLPVPLASTSKPKNMGCIQPQHLATDHAILARAMSSMSHLLVASKVPAVAA